VPSGKLQLFLCFIHHLRGSQVNIHVHVGVVLPQKQFPPGVCKADVIDLKHVRGYCVSLDSGYCASLPTIHQYTFTTPEL